ncbi:hypothetical protein F511_20373 [Dorcoceras hygrometricum]|uniref:Uncharacterized protein n=1 Tax=Dorcoceras hygrometricum TaxID=472368 RepID=A0A2Z7CSM1_9LAMI|nr:hypothetical protein F511_20373 [Dorcoceras hygrometricum]
MSQCERKLDLFNVSVQRLQWRVLNHIHSYLSRSTLKYCGSLRQSGPRPDPRLLRQAVLEALTRSARTDSPRRTGRKAISGDDRRRRVGGGGGGGLFERGRRRWCLGFRVMLCRVTKTQCKMTVLPLNSGKPRFDPLLTFRKSHFPKSSSRAQHIELSIRAGISNLVLV